MWDSTTYSKEIVIYNSWFCLCNVKVLGTFITEWDEGRVACNELLLTKESAHMYAERLAELAVALGFDGWLVCIYESCIISNFILYLLNINASGWLCNLSHANSTFLE